MSKNNPKTYSLTLSDEHLRVVMDALDFYERMGMGQFHELLRLGKQVRPQALEDRASIEALIDLVRHRLMPELQSPNAYHSIRSKEISDDFRVGYDLIQVIRHRLAWDAHPEGGWAVNFDAPLRTSEKLPLAEIQPASSSVSLAQSGSRSKGSSVQTKSGSKSSKGRRKASSSVVR